MSSTSLPEHFTNNSNTTPFRLRGGNHNNTTPFAFDNDRTLGRGFGIDSTDSADLEPMLSETGPTWKKARFGAVPLAQSPPPAPSPFPFSDPFMEGEERKEF